MEALLELKAKTHVLAVTVTMIVALAICVTLLLHMVLQASMEYQTRDGKTALNQANIQLNPDINRSPVFNPNSDGTLY